MNFFMKRKYIPVALYTFGKCYHGHYGNPFETVLIEADSKA